MSRIWLNVEISAHVHLNSYCVTQITYPDGQSAENCEISQTPTYHHHYYASLGWFIRYTRIRRLERESIFGTYPVTCEV